MTDIIETMRAEIDEAVELMRPHFPNDSDADLIARAQCWRWRLYKEGHWPDFAEMARKEAAEVAAKEAILRAAATPTPEEVASAPISEETAATPTPEEIA